MNSAVINNSVVMNNSAVMNNISMNNSAVMEAMKNGMKQLATRLMESTPMVCLGLIFSIILGEDVTPLHALRLLNVLVSGLCAFLLGGFGLGIQLLLLAWFGLSCWTATRK